MSFWFMGFLNGVWCMCCARVSIQTALTSYRRFKALLLSAARLDIFIPVNCGYVRWINWAALNQFSIRLHNVCPNPSVGAVDRTCSKVVVTGLISPRLSCLKKTMCVEWPAASPTTLSAQPSPYHMNEAFPSVYAAEVKSVGFFHSGGAHVEVDAGLWKHYPQPDLWKEE